jgi:nucleoside-diphosphate-sugar epimerase
MRILVLGNLGYVGTVLTRYLRANGHTVTGFDIGYFEDCTIAEPPAPDRQYFGDVRDVPAEIYADIDAVIHLAALSNDTLGELSAGVTYDINVGGLARSIAHAQAAGIERFVFASSCSMYGSSAGDAPLNESARQSPLTAYAKSKCEGEALLQAATGERFRPTALRFSTAYGWSERPRLCLVVNNLAACGLAAGRIDLESDGTPWRPLIHVEDMARAMEAVLTAPLDRVGARSFNVGTTAENYQVRTIATTVAALLGNLPVTVGASGGSDQRSYNVDFTAFHTAVPKFKAAWTMEAGARDLIERFRRLFDPADFRSDRFFRIRRITSLIAAGDLTADLHSLRAVQPTVM